MHVKNFLITYLRRQNFVISFLHNVGNTCYIYNFVKVLHSRMRNGAFSAICGCKRTIPARVISSPALLSLITDSLVNRIGSRR